MTLTGADHGEGPTPPTRRSRVDFDHARSACPSALAARPGLASRPFGPILQDLLKQTDPGNGAEAALYDAVAALADAGVFLNEKTRETQNVAMVKELALRLNAPVHHLAVI